MISEVGQLDYNPGICLEALGRPWKPTSGESAFCLGFEAGRLATWCRHITAQTSADRAGRYAHAHCGIDRVSAASRLAGSNCSSHL